MGSSFQKSLVVQDGLYPLPELANAEGFVEEGGRAVGAVLLLALLRLEGCQGKYRNRGFALDLLQYIPAIHIRQGSVQDDQVGLDDIDLQ
jgi:hypothetical protein